jgi:DNA-binding IclR family transcriptional regulator
VSAGNGSQAVDRALTILHLFAATGTSWSLAELAAETGLPVSTVHRMVKSLAGRELIVVDPRTKRYSVGAEVMRLAQGFLNSDPVARVQALAQPHIESLHASCRETVNLQVNSGTHRICVFELPSTHPIRMVTTVGGVYPLHAGAAGKALLAWLPDADRRRLLSSQPLTPVTSSTISELDVLEADLRETRDRGYAVSYGEVVEGAAALAAPIFGVQRAPVGVINITGPNDRFDAGAIRRTANALRAACTDISVQMGHPSPAPQR